MSVEHIAILKRAASLLKDGKTKDARKLIISVLREDQENAQAWYMLSFAVPVVEKQIHALQQALLYKPDNAKVLERLEKLGGLPLSSSDSIPPFTEPQPKLEPEPDSLPQPVQKQEPAPSPPEPKPRVSDEDLLSFRLFGGSDPAQSVSEKSDVEQNLSDAEREPARELSPEEALDLVKRAVEEKSDPEVDFGDVPREEILQRRFQPPKKIFGIKRNVALISIAVLAVAVIAIIAIGPALTDLLFNFENNQLAATNQSSTQIDQSEEPQEATPDEVLVEQPTETPSFTPTPSQRLFNLSYFSTPDFEISLKFEEIQQNLAALIGAVDVPAINSIAITEPQLQTLLWDFAKIDHFDDQTQTSEGLYTLLGLTEIGNDYSAFYQNFWVDPNGTLVIPQQDAIAVIGFDFSDYQKYSYAQAVIQVMRRYQYGELSSLFQTYPCYAPTETCDIANAVIKGDAAFTGMQWASSNFPADTFEELSDTTLKYFYSPIFPVPNQFMEELRSSMYTDGSAFIQQIQQSRGWPGVDTVYLDPPKSTEQILHPEKYLAGELPTEFVYPNLAEALSDEWIPVYQDSLGEWRTFLILAHQPFPGLNVEIETAQTAADGWNGDFTQIFSNANSSENIIAHHWLWDNQNHQQEFETVLRTIEIANVAGVEEAIQGVACNQSSNQVSCILSLDNQTIWILTPDSETAGSLLSVYLPTE